MRGVFGVVIVSNRNSVSLLFDRRVPFWSDFLFLCYCFFGVIVTGWVWWSPFFSFFSYPLFHAGEISQEGLELAPTPN